MSDPASAAWQTVELRDLIIRKFTGPSPTCEERPIASEEEWGILKTTAITWDGWNERAHKVPPPQYWGRSSIEVNVGDVLITKAGPRHRVGVPVYVHSTSPRLMVSGKMIGLRPDTRRVNARFLASMLATRQVQDYLDSRTTGMAESQTNFSDEALLAARIPLPPLSEQRRIAEILDSLDDQIRSTEQVRSKLQLQKAGVLNDLTADKGDTVRLGDLAERVTSGSRGWAQYYADDGPLFIRIGNLTRSHINLRLDSLVHVSAPAGTEGSRTVLRPGDVLVSITADLGIIGVVPSGMGEAYINQHIALVRADQAKSNPRWIGHYLASPRGQGQFRRLNDQGAKAGLNLPTVSSLQVAVPPASEQVRAVAVLDQLDARVAQLEVEAMKLMRLKAGLMADLLTGRIRVPQEVAS